jgi:hypothetical protein
MSLLQIYYTHILLSFLRGFKQVTTADGTEPVAGLAGAMAPLMALFFYTKNTIDQQKIKHII